MKKVLIVTKIGKNYGALLQAYALKTIIENKGHKVEILNYELKQTMNTYRVFPMFKNWRSIIKILQSIPRAKATKKSVEQFLQFRKDYLNLTIPYKNYTELMENPPIADIYITGSDQVWNPKINFDKAYYLLFGKEDIIRASYAASIGISCIPENVKQEFARRMKNIEYYSVREDEGQKILEEIGINAIVNVDPTLLLEKKDYDLICKNPTFQRPYVLLYLLIMPENVNLYMQKVREEYPDCLIVSIPGSSYAKRIGDIECSDIGPKEFIGLIKNAEAVFTSSFHGTVFSILYKKRFVSYLPQNTGNRIRNLLNSFNLTERIVDSPVDLEILSNPIDYSFTENMIVQKKILANEYLDKIMEGQ